MVSAPDLAQDPIARGKRGLQARLGPPVRIPRTALRRLPRNASCGHPEGTLPSLGPMIEPVCPPLQP